ncbi:MAG: hypothetical protein KKB90_11695 [Actinobacteria bacterium]|nr:hypothetical protein [Actinomycetota bacterium]MCG2818210.1 hypothetical protein [Actinomycetes bacterium]MBU4219607.1 hypothetical protein [Actinomycetota bacterium]MBU4358448.1 hypothetical protein [Actinomycetota bacterium]MBU4392465.1 hypothetical protein [Actinomycetota bacterium]
MFKIIHTRKRYLVTICLLAVLVVVALLAVSCGDKGTKTGESDNGDTSSGEEVSVDDYIQELDGDMNSVDPNDFSDSELDDSKLGL